MRTLKPIQHHWDPTTRTLHITVPPAQHPAGLLKLIVPGIMCTAIAAAVSVVLLRDFATQSTATLWVLLTFTIVPSLAAMSLFLGAVNVFTDRSDITIDPTSLIFRRRAIRSVRARTFPINASTVLRVGPSCNDRRTWSSVSLMPTGLTLSTDHGSEWFAVQLQGGDAKSLHALIPPFPRPPLHVSANRREVHL